MTYKHYHGYSVSQYRSLNLTSKRCAVCGSIVPSSYGWLLYFTTFVSFFVVGMAAFGVLR